MNAKPIVGSLKSRPTVVLCARDQDELNAMGAFLSQIGYVVHTVKTIEELDELLLSKPVQAIVAHFAPSRQEFLSILSRPGLPPVIPLLGYSDRYLYTDLLSRGAFDCLPLPAQSGELKRVLSLAIKNKRNLAVSQTA